MSPPRLRKLQWRAAWLRKAICQLAPLLVVALYAPRVDAQSVDPRLFDATTSPGAIIGLETAWLPRHLERYVGLGLTYANDELVATRPDGVRVHAPLHTRWITSLGFGIGLFDRLEAQLGLPLHSNTGGDGKSFGVGDLRLALRGELARSGAFGFVAQLAVSFPTGGKVAFSGDDGVVFDPRLVLDWRNDDGLALALHLGYRVRPERAVFDLTIDDELRYGLGIEVPAGALGASARVALVGEVEGAIGIVDPGSAGQRPLEARLGLRLFGDQWALTFATGTGLTAGYGAPDLRFFVGFSFAPSTLTGPRPAPPTTLVVGGPAPAPEFPKVAGFSDPRVLEEAMRADPDQDGDGIPMPADQCPNEPEDFDGGNDSDGCPDPDDDNDGVLDAADKCPTEAETPNGIKDDDGCPDEGQASVVAADGVIALVQTIEFQSGSDVLAPSATPLIAEIAAVLKANPKIKRVRIEGHTDGEGDEEMNVDLSERRAARVRQKLMELGVDGQRLLPKGYGATRGLAPDTTPEGRKKNRRVEFRIIDPPPPGAPRVDFEVAP